MLELIIVRGLPGSGKSTFARTFSYNHYEADMYFYDEKGNYNYCKSKLVEAHNKCFDDVVDSLTIYGQSAVVSNTFTQLEFIKRYTKYVSAFGIPITIHEMLGNYGNIHNVPESDIAKLKRNWQEIPHCWGIQVIKHY